jgi:hypothetical protein
VRETDRPLRRIGWRHQRPQRIEDLLELRTRGAGVRSCLLPPVDYGTSTIWNMTLPGHLLYPGSARRDVVFDG